ncbi:hypothetical protein P5704_025125 (plasmid) [Pseudomonas sp. FeN3W]|nr:hypothetical protein P5704_025125 [Pseudomonas sp. FeN3W]
MKLLAAIAITIGILASNASLAANIYTKGTDAHFLSSTVASLLPANMIPVIVVENNRKGFLSQVNAHAAEAAGTSINNISKIYSADWKVGIPTAVAYADVIDLTREADGASICVMRFKDNRYIKAALMHEAMHCRTTQLAEWNEFAPQANKLINLQIRSSSGDLISKKLKQYILEEVHARIMSFAIMKETGSIDDAQFFIHRLSAEFPKNPGKNSIKHAISICNDNGGCATDASDLMSILAEDKGFISAFAKDVDSAYMFHLKKGTIALFSQK